MEIILGCIHSSDPHDMRSWTHSFDLINIPTSLNATASCNLAAEFGNVKRYISWMIDASAPDEAFFIVPRVTIGRLERIISKPSIYHSIAFLLLVLCGNMSPALCKSQNSAMLFLAPMHLRRTIGDDMVQIILPLQSQSWEYNRYSRILPCNWTNQTQYYAIDAPKKKIEMRGEKSNRSNDCMERTNHLQIVNHTLRLVHLGTMLAMNRTESYWEIGSIAELQGGE